MDGESKRSHNRLGVILQNQPSEPESLPLDYLREITNNFCDEHLLGKGGFGIVYKGVKQNGDMIAVKKLTLTEPGSQDRQFENEVRHLMGLKHPNIVQLVGYCSETQIIPLLYKGKYICAEKLERFICLEYLPKGSLREHLSDEKSGLDWDTRYRIIQGICYGLHYLHEEWNVNTPIIHMDLKPPNILLDDNMVPKIADFGLSRLFGEEQTRTCTASRYGTLGYLAPEYINRGIITKKSDIFSLGVIIIEIMTGRKDYPYETETSSQKFTELVLKNWRNRLENASRYAFLETDCQQIRRCIEIGLACVKVDWEERPTTFQIIKLLHGLEGAEYNNERLGLAPGPPGTDFRISGSTEEVDELCRSLGLSGPEEFAIPITVWEAHKVRSNSNVLPRSRLEPSPPADELSPVACTVSAPEVQLQLALSIPAPIPEESLHSSSTSTAYYSAEEPSVAAAEEPSIAGPDMLLPAGAHGGGRENVHHRVMGVAPAPVGPAIGRDDRPMRDAVVGGGEEEEQEGQRRLGTVESSRGFRHMMRERQRREKLSQSYADLYAMVAARSKGDKNSIAQSAAIYIRELEGARQQLQQKNQELKANILGHDERQQCLKVQFEVDEPSWPSDSMIAALWRLKRMEVRARGIRSDLSGRRLRTEMNVETMIAASKVEKAVEAALKGVEGVPAGA